MDAVALENSERRATVARLRDRAQHCRAMADRAVSNTVAAELAAIAREYERDAVALELKTGPSAA
jgi:hypothetical protein